MQKLADIKTKFPEWYQEVIEAAELSEHSPTPGCMVIRPYGYSIWERMQEVLNKKIKEQGVDNAYFPLLIPKSFIEKEAKHVEGFSPELAVVTHAGGKDLDEPLVVRPTSETMVYYMFAKWIKSWRNLPLKINQWANVMRWEMRPRAFLRSREFLWQEGHTAHGDLKEAEEFAKIMHKIYVEFARDYLAIPTIAGEKSESERFAGADHTYTFEGIMQDGKALQMGTAHVLSKSFSDAFGISYQGKDGKLQSPHCTSWGVTTRMIGALIMVHGDQNGLIMPPKIAPIQVVIVPIYRKDTEDAVINKANSIKDSLQALGISCKVDLDDTKTPGAKFYHWEVKGVPLRIELGPKDLANNQAVLVNRVEQDKDKKKTFVNLDEISNHAASLLDEIQVQLLARATKNQESMWRKGESLVEFGKVLESDNCFYQTGWCGAAKCEEKLKEYKATIRCLLSHEEHKVCFACGNDSNNDVIVAKAY